MDDLTKNFSAHEFLCKCPNPDCEGKDTKRIPLEEVQRLQRVRDDVDEPIVVRSGLRCVFWNKNEGGKADSSHLKWALDLGCATNRLRYKLVVAALKEYNRIGLGSSFIHVDRDPAKADRLIWTYYPKKKKGG